VVSQSVHPGASGAMVYLEPDLRCTPRCHACGSPGTVHSKGCRRIVRDLALADRRTYLQVDYRKVWCSQCYGARVERHSFVDASSRVTLRLARYIYQLCKELPVTTVAGPQRSPVRCCRRGRLRSQVTVAMSGRREPTGADIGPCPLPPMRMDVVGGRYFMAKTSRWFRKYGGTIAGMFDSGRTSLETSNPSTSVMNFRRAWQRARQSG